MGRVAVEWGGTEEVEKLVCEESGLGEPAKGEVGLAASFPLPSQQFTTKKLSSGQLTMGKLICQKKREVSAVQSGCSSSPHLW